MRLSARRPVLVAALAAASIAGFAGTAALAPVAEVRADDTADALAALDAVVKGGDENKVIAKIGELEPKLDPSVTDALLKLARSTKSDRIFKTALKVCANRKHDGTYSFLKAKLKDDDMAKDQPEKFFAVLDNLKSYEAKLGGDKAVMKGLEDIVKKFLAANSGVANRAIAAYGTAQDFGVVSQLIEWLLETEKTKGSGGGAGGAAKALGAEAKKNYAEISPVIVRTLESLTGQTFAAGPDWAKWWKDSKEKCEWPDKNAPTEPDYATLTAHVDKAYGFTLKKPEDGNKSWKFVKPEDKGQRCQLENRDGSGMLWARCKVSVYSDTGGTYKDAEAFAKYFMDDSINLQKDFEAWAPGGEAKIEETAIDGRKFAVLRARGKAKDRWKNWDACERRIYVTSPSAKVYLWFECAVRTSWEQPLIDSFWKTILDVKFKGPAK